MKFFECKDVAEEANNYLDGDLPLRKRIGLFLHLVICSCCRNYLQQLRETIKTVSVLKPKEKASSDNKALAEELMKLSQEDK
jgi:predicted anti-sigma-YlaC factor YlaD